MVWEVDAISAKTNSTTRIRGRTLRAEFNSKDVRHRAQKWNVGPERRKERETFCRRFGKRTPFLRWRAQLHDTRKSAQKRITGKSFTVRRIWVWALQFA